MAFWLFDPQRATRKTHFFLLPYPLPGNWPKEQEVNQRLLPSMREALMAYHVFSGYDAAKGLSDEEDRAYRRIHAQMVERYGEEGLQWPISR